MELIELGGVRSMSKGQFSRRVVLFVMIFVAMFIGLAGRVSATVILPNLPANSEYQLIFATSGEINSTSGTIGTYNAFVTQTRRR